MKTVSITSNWIAFVLLLCSLFICTEITAQKLSNFTEYKGEVVNAASNNELEFASLTVKNTNIRTITNTEGNFVLKVPNDKTDAKVYVSLIGFQPRELPLSQLIGGDVTIKLEEKVVELSEVNVTTFKSAKALVQKVFDQKAENNLNIPVKMNAFYRETIKRRNRNVSLTEAVVNLYKKRYTSSKKDVLELHKARKSTDYRRLDTVALKLQGGPFSTLYLDVMKYPEYIFTNETIEKYTFSFNKPTTINGKPVYVVHFQQTENTYLPHYEGTLYIAYETLALTSASYKLNIENKREASKIFVKSKPRKIRVYPLEAHYKVDYREKDGKWYYSYANLHLLFKVDERGKLFNKRYSIDSEMAVTDWESNDSAEKPKNKMKPTVIMSDEVSGFSDPDFWGRYNVIEPEKSIENAIGKIQKRIDRSKN